VLKSGSGFFKYANLVRGHEIADNRRPKRSVHPEPSGRFDHTRKASHARDKLSSEAAM
jgi:hypothetical protein